MRNTGKPSSVGSDVDVRLEPELGKALGALAETIEEFAANWSLGGEIPFRLNLAMDELITNSVNYGLTEVAKPELRIRLHHAPDCVIAQIEDNGPEFDPFEEAPKPDTSQALDDRPIGGLGVFFRNAVHG